MHQTDIYIPKPLAEYALTEGCVPQLRTYVYMKMSCSGKARVTKGYVEKLCKTLSIHRSTFYRHLKWLTERKWICKSARSGLHFIISFKRLLKKKGLKGRTTAYFRIEWFDRFKAFLSGAIIGHLCKRQARAASKKGLANKLWPVATKALATILGLPESTAYNLKQKAAQEGFIIKQRDFKATGVPSSQIHSFRKAYPEVAHKAVADNGEVKLCKPDKCNGLVSYKTKRL